MEILAIDPGNEQSAFVLWDGTKIISAATMQNGNLLKGIISSSKFKDEMVIEMVASYGMAVGKTVFETVFWIGRFFQAFNGGASRMFRKDVKMHLCGQTKAKDSNISQALRDRFGEKPTKAKPSPVYGDVKLKKDEWQAFALAVTWWDLNKSGQIKLTHEWETVSKPWVKDVKVYDRILSDEEIKTSEL